jgi:hypothetical protein
MPPVDLLFQDRWFQSERLEDDLTGKVHHLDEFRYDQCSLGRITANRRTSTFSTGAPPKHFVEARYGAGILAPGRLKISENNRVIGSSL